MKKSWTCEAGGVHETIIDCVKSDPHLSEGSSIASVLSSHSSPATSPSGHLLALLAGILLLKPLRVDWSKVT